MQIIQIKRKVSRYNYGKIELTADILPDEDVIECAKELDKKARTALMAIEEYDTIKNLPF